MAKKNASASPRPATAARFTDTHRVEELIALMVENGLTEIELAEDKSRIVLRRGTLSAGMGAASAPAHHTLLNQAPAPAPQPAAPLPAPDVDADLVPIKSPMVGTFYAAPNPESDAYVSIGSAIDEKSVVCIIEAMKVFNEIHAETRGTIARVLVSNGQTVEFGQPMFLVRPS